MISTTTGFLDSRCFSHGGEPLIAARPNQVYRRRLPEPIRQTIKQLRQRVRQRRHDAADAAESDAIT